MKKRNIKTVKKTTSKPNKTVKKAGKSKKKSSDSSLKIVNPNAAGIDVGAEEHWVCVPEDRVNDGEWNIKSFRCYTPDLHRLIKWLKSCDIDTVALESTGVYWLPLYQLLEKDGFKVCLVNTKHMKNVKGRPKTDRLDSQWLMRLHTYGLLAPSFRPKDEICVLRSLSRWRETLIESSADYIRRMSKMLQEMNVRLDRAVRDITGATGLRIIEAIINGEKNPHKLAKLRDCRCKKSEDQIAMYLSGDFRWEHIFVLENSYKTYQYFQDQIKECEKKIEEQLQTLTPGKASLKANYKKLLEKFEEEEIQKNSVDEMKELLFPNPFTDMETYLKELTGVDFTAIPGIDVQTVQVLISEVGLDLSSWETAAHFTAWLGLAPCPNKSGTSKNKKQHTNKVQNRAARAFRMAALALSESKTHLGSFYRRIRSRAGGSTAITATARKLAVIFYNMLKNGTEFIELGEDHYLKTKKERYLKSAKRNLKDLGYEVVKIDEQEKQKKSA